MAIRFMYDNYVDLSTTTITASSQATGFPASNVAHIWHTRHWRTTAISGQWIKFDLGSIKQTQCVIIKYHNKLSTSGYIAIEANSSDSWASPAFSENMGDYVEDEILIYFFPADKWYRWWRIYINDPDNTDGYLRMGRIYLGKYFGPERHFMQPHTKQRIDPSVKRYSTGGQISISQRESYIQIPYDFRSIALADVPNFKTMWNSVGQSMPYFVCEIPSSNPHLTTYYVINSDPWNIEEMSAKGSLLVNCETMR